MDEQKTVILVGHCGADAAMLTGAVRSAAPGARVVRNNDEKSLWATPADLLLVNRVLDGRYEDEEGLGLIRRAVERGVPAILVSNYADAQAAAEADGALPGFGKRAARSEEAMRAIRTALAREGQ